MEASSTRPRAHEAAAEAAPTRVAGQDELQPDHRAHRAAMEERLPSSESCDLEYLRARRATEEKQLSAPSMSDQMAEAQERSPHQGQGGLRRMRLHHAAAADLR
eukprot:TRINITY_DN27374_c0_g2_i5.p2 TRINITY_DN27374_c0_g2~~TRINITY_DN27374_c0_g2_i5.p2  ORF type:complete len:104 (+),score=21.68 TRINITY_DN27374_c0_g2_i5:387-698(+)